jgi:hypothetical protein
LTPAVLFTTRISDHAINNTSPPKRPTSSNSGANFRLLLQACKHVKSILITTIIDRCFQQWIAVTYKKQQQHPPHHTEKIVQLKKIGSTNNCHVIVIIINIVNSRL